MMMWVFLSRFAVSSTVLLGYEQVLGFMSWFLFIALHIHCTLAQPKATDMHVATESF